MGEGEYIIIKYITFFFFKREFQPITSVSKHILPICFKVYTNFFKNNYNKLDWVKKKETRNN